MYETKEGRRRRRRNGERKKRAYERRIRGKSADRYISAYFKLRGYIHAVSPRKKHDLIAVQIGRLHFITSLPVSSAPPSVTPSFVSPSPLIVLRLSLAPLLLSLSLSFPETAGLRSQREDISKGIALAPLLRLARRRCRRGNREKREEERERTNERTEELKRKYIFGTNRTPNRPIEPESADKFPLYLNAAVVLCC